MNVVGPSPSAVPNVAIPTIVTSTGAGVSTVVTSREVSPWRTPLDQAEDSTLTDLSMEEIGGDAPACEHRAVRNLGASALWGLAIGSSLVVGAVVAARTSLPPAVAEFATAFGGGLLLAAIALELVPAADEAAVRHGQLPA